MQAALSGRGDSWLYLSLLCGRRLGDLGDPSRTLQRGEEAGGAGGLGKQVTVLPDPNPPGVGETLNPMSCQALLQGAPPLSGLRREMPRAVW